MKNKFEVNVNLQATVNGLRFGQKFNIDTKKYEEDKTSFQVQTIITNKKGEDEKKTIRVHKVVTQEQLESFMGKSYVFVNVTEYTHKNSFNINGNEVSFNTYTYAATDLKEIKSEEDIFEVNKSVEIFVDKVIDILDREGNSTNSTKIQTKIQDGLSIDIKTIKIKEVPFALLENLKGKKVFVDKLTITKSNNKTNYSTELKPEILK